MLTTTKTIRKIPDSDKYEMITTQISGDRMMSFNKQTLAKQDVILLVNRAAWNLIKIWIGNKSHMAYQWVGDEPGQEIFRKMTFFDLHAGALVWEVGTPKNLFLRFQISDGKISLYIENTGTGIKLHKPAYTVVSTDHRGVSVIDHKADDEIKIKLWGDFMVVNEELLKKSAT